MQRFSGALGFWGFWEDGAFVLNAMAAPPAREWTGLQQFPVATQTALHNILGKLRQQVCLRRASSFGSGFEILATLVWFVRLWCWSWNRGKQTRLATLNYGDREIVIGCVVFDV